MTGLENEGAEEFNILKLMDLKESNSQSYRTIIRCVAMHKEVKCHKMIRDQTVGLSLLITHLHSFFS